jgi:hypothetical protein
MKKLNLRDISCKMRDEGFDVSFRDCPTKGGTGGHPCQDALKSLGEKQTQDTNTDMILYAYFPL